MRRRPDAASASGPADPDADAHARNEARTPEPLDPSALAGRLIERMAAEWRAGRRPLAEDLLAAHPGLGDHPEVVVRLIYEEVCLRRDAGQPTDPGALARRFPHLRAELDVLLDCDRLLDPAAVEPEFPEVGEDLGGFRLLAELGRGLQGRVYLASQPALADRPVVVKVTPTFGGEHQSLARLQHAHVVPLLSAHDLPDRGLRVLCLPYLGGTTLDVLLGAVGGLPPARRAGLDLLAALDEAGAASPLPATAAGPARRFLERESYTRSVCWIAACLADALDHAHRRGLVHLDVKPANVLLTADGMPMLLDFHLARAPLLADDPPPEWLGGTPEFQAPEQEAAMASVRQGRPVPEAVDARADVYALGVVLYRALGGTGPLPEARASARQLRRANPRVGVALADLVARCLRPDQGRRYEDAAAVGEDLRRHLADRPLRGVRNRSVGETWAKWRRRRPHALTRAGAVLVCAAGVAAAGWAAWFSESRRASEAEAALVEGHRRLEAGAPEEAARTLRNGLDRLEAGRVVEALRPDVGRLRVRIQAELERARRAGRAAGLHALADQARFLFAAGPLEADAARALEGRLGAIWAARGSVASRLGDDLKPEYRTRLRDDLLDLAILRADLLVRLSEDRGRDEATRDALRVLDEAEAACGPSPVLSRERRAHAEALGLVEKARAEAVLAGSRGPRTAWEHYALGRSLLRDGQLPAAASALDEAVELQPQGLWPQFYRGQCALRRGRPAEALDAFGACVALAPDVGACRYNRGLAYAGLGDHARARRDVEAARLLDPALPAAWHDAPARRAPTPGPAGRAPRPTVRP